MCYVDLHNFIFALGQILQPPPPCLRPPSLDGLLTPPSFLALVPLGQGKDLGQASDERAEPQRDGAC